MDINLIDNLSPIFFTQIFEKLDNLNDQVAMSLAYPQFSEAIQKIWTRNNYVIGPSTKYLYELECEYYVAFIKQMTSFFKELHLLPFSGYDKFYDYYKHFNLINIKTFPNVKRAILQASTEIMNDQDFRDLADLCPNLKVIKTNMKITGLYLHRFRNLEELYFESYCGSVPLSNSIMQEVCLGMKSLRILDITDRFRSHLRLNNIDLPNLEVLMANLDTIETMVDSILKLPKLKTLGVYYDDSRQMELETITILQEIIVAKSDSITGIAVNNVVLDLHSNWYENTQMKLPKLRKLICDHWIYDSVFLDKPFIYYNKLEVFSFHGWLNVNSDLLAKTCEKFPNLRDLHVSESEASIQTLQSIEKVRFNNIISDQKPLRVFCKNKWAHFTKKNKEIWMKNSYVQISMDHKEFDYIYVGFQIDFE